MNLTARLHGIEANVIIINKRSFLVVLNGTDRCADIWNVLNKRRIQMRKVYSVCGTDEMYCVLEGRSRLDLSHEDYLDIKYLIERSVLEMKYKEREQ